MQTLNGMKAGLTSCLLATLLTACSRQPANLDASWNRKGAATYLDEREAQWRTWPRAARGQGTFCISCHTTLPYALARPALAALLGEKTAPLEERKLVDDVRERVRLWTVSAAYYEGKEDESRGTEAVLNALILASHDALNGEMSADTRSAFDHMWASQIKQGDDKGVWAWLQFNSEPWEAQDSRYYGACLAAVAVGMAPGNYRATAAIQNNLEQLRDYLNRHESEQTPINRVGLLWASEQLPGLARPEMRQSIIQDILSRQQPDGGWSLSSLVGNWQRKDSTPLVRKSDGYATGYITFVLQKAGLSRDEVAVERGLSWLTRNQNWWNSHWFAYSLNKRRHNPFSQVSRFMDDAATAYAVLALTQSTHYGEQVAVKDAGLARSRRTRLEH